MNEAKEQTTYGLQYRDVDGAWRDSAYPPNDSLSLDEACEYARGYGMSAGATRLLQNGIILYTYDPAEERGPDTVADALDAAQDAPAVPSVLAEAMLAAAVKVDPPRTPKLPTPAADADRKAIPVWTGCVRYFPSALLEVAKVSKAGNDQHNPGQPLHWAQGKSMNQTDTCMRHQLDADACEGTPEEIPHLAQAAWRLLARLQLACQREGAPLAPGARSPEVTK